MTDVAALAPFDMLAHLARQACFSERTFGPGRRTEGVVDHIRKELLEVLAAPDDLTEWVDVVILAFDGAWRTGATPRQIIDAVVAKQTKNEGRAWPDWRTVPAGKAIEHDRSAEDTVLGDSRSPTAPADTLIGKLESQAIWLRSLCNEAPVIRDAAADVCDQAAWTLRQRSRCSTGSGGTQDGG